MWELWGSLRQAKLCSLGYALAYQPQELRASSLTIITANALWMSFETKLNAHFTSKLRSTRDHVNRSDIFRMLRYGYENYIDPELVLESIPWAPKPLFQLAFSQCHLKEG